VSRKNDPNGLEVIEKECKLHTIPNHPGNTPGGQYNSPDQLIGELTRAQAKAIKNGFYDLTVRFEHDEGIEYCSLPSTSVVLYGKRLETPTEHLTRITSLLAKEQRDRSQTEERYLHHQSERGTARLKELMSTALVLKGAVATTASAVRGKRTKT